MLKYLVIGACAALAACGGASNRQMSVWDIYDVRHPVPAGSTVPVSRASYYDQYMDNDAYYTPPAYGTCAANDPTMVGCE